MRFREASRRPIALAIPLLVVVGILFLPWPDGRGKPFGQWVRQTAGDLQRDLVRLSSSERRLEFQANLNTPEAGEFVLPLSVREMLTILRKRGLPEYRISSVLASDEWTKQQIVASAWPKRLEPEAAALFLANDELIAGNCDLVERQEVVTLVYCH